LLIVIDDVFIIKFGASLRLTSSYVKKDDFFLIKMYKDNILLASDYNLKDETDKVFMIQKWQLKYTVRQ
jgi:hypothetical protein